MYTQTNAMDYPQLAWHETLELHELTAFQSHVLMKCKMALRKVPDPTLQNIYIESIQILENNLKELLQFYPYEPRSPKSSHHVETGFYAGDLLGAAKTAVRSYAIAITETATPQLREVFNKQLQGAIRWHGKIYYYMAERGYYPSYNLEKLLKNDVKNAQKAIQMNY